MTDPDLLLERKFDRGRCVARRDGGKPPIDGAR